MKKEVGCFILIIVVAIILFIAFTPLKVAWYVAIPLVIFALVLYGYLLEKFDKN